MDEDYNDYENFLDNPPRLIACPPDNVTLLSDVGGPGGYCVKPFVLDGSRQTVAIYGVVSPLFVAMTLITNCLVCVVLVKPTMRTCTSCLEFRAPTGRKYIQPPRSTCRGGTRQICSYW